MTITPTDRLFRSVANLDRPTGFIDDQEKSEKQIQREKKKKDKFMDNVLSSIDLIKNDIEGVYDDITRQAPEHVN